MALKVVNTESLDAVANAINAKAGTSGAIQFPDGFVEAIGAIQTGGGGESKLPSVVDGTVTELTAEDLAGATKIRAYAFCQAGSLISIHLPETVTRIESYAFRYSAIANVIFPKSLTSIGEYVFQNCTNLESIDVPSGVQTLSNYVFSNCTYLASVTLHEGLTRIDGYVFQNCSHLESLSIPNSVTLINASAFYGCTRLANINLPNVLENIYESTFYGCTSLTNIVLPDSLTNIGSGAFRGCSKLGSIALPNGVPALKSKVFYGCTALEYIDLTAYGTDGTLPTLANTDAFYNCGKNTSSGTFEIRVSAGRKAELSAMTNWSAYADNIVEV